MSGLGGGLLAALATVSLGQTENPDRNYGLLFAAQLLFATGGLWGFPPLLDRFTLNSAYWLIALLALLVGFAAASLPQGRAERVQSRADAMRGRWLLAPAVLASILLFFAEQNAIWAYIERIGNGAGLSAHYIGFSLGVATLTGFAGAALVAWAGTRVGRLIPLALATLLQLGCLVTLVGHAAPAAYLFSTAVLALSWNVVNPFQLGILAEVDPSGKALALAATVTGVGMAAGPAVAAFTIDGDGYTAILWLAGVLAVVSLVLVLPALQTIRRTVMGS